MTLRNMLGPPRGQLGAFIAICYQQQANRSLGRPATGIKSLSSAEQNLQNRRRAGTYTLAEHIDVQSAESAAMIRKYKVEKAPGAVR